VTGTQFMIENLTNITLAQNMSTHLLKRV